MGEARAKRRRDEEQAASGVPKTPKAEPLRERTVAFPADVLNALDQAKWEIEVGIATQRGTPGQVPTLDWSALVVGFLRMGVQLYELQKEAMKADEAKAAETRLVQPAAHVPAGMAEAATRLQALRAGEPR